MKLSQWAKKEGISYVTAFNWFKNGKLPVEAYQTKTKTIIVKENFNANQKENIAIYCRVSSHNKKDDLERQVKRCSDFCFNNGWEINEIVKEIASGMNDSRPKLIKLFNKNPTKIIIEHKDRLTRFGFNYIEYFLNKQNCQIVVINRDKQKDDDLMKDLVSVVTSFCCRLYGLRKTKNKMSKIKELLNNQ